MVALLVLASGLGVGGYLLFSGGGDDGETGGAASPAAGGGCFKVEHPQDLGNAHLNAGESFDRYSSNPPTSGPHDPTPTEAGVIYKKPQPVEMLVHSMEHGAVVFWENGLSDQLESEAKDAVNAAYSEGYHSLIVTPYDGMDVPFAMTAWGTLQKCVGVDVQLIRSFVHRFYASGQEGALACQGESSTVPACQKTG